MGNDPLGKALLDYLEKPDINAKINVFSTTMESNPLSVPFLFRTFEGMPLIEKKALELCKGKILDIGAGAGSHALELQKKGMNVSVLDNSKGAIEAMKIRGLKNVFHQNIFEHTENQYDTLLMMMNGIGLVGNLEGLDKFLNQVKKILNPKGQIILESSDIQHLYNEITIEALLNYPNRYYGIVTYWMEYKNQKSELFDWLFIDFERLKKHCSKNEFRLEKIYEGKDNNFLGRITNY